MKKLILLIAIVVSAFSAFAQDSLYINQKDGSIIPFAIINMDSISFERINSSKTIVTDYVVINGIKWATRNLDTGGKFVANPEGLGALFQWGRKADGHENRSSSISTTTTLSTTDDPGNNPFIGSRFIRSTKANDYGNGTYDWRSPKNDALWNAGTELVPIKATNDPSPAGYRVPNYTEIQSLLDTTYVKNEWITQNGVYGQKFTDKASNNSIFLPAAGVRTPDDCIVYYADGFYASGGYSCSTTSDNNGVYGFGFGYDRASLGAGSDRSYGHSVRPVVESTHDSLYVNQKDGSVVPFSIDNVDTITFVRKTYSTPAPAVTDYVVINGIKWATRNLDTGGKFVSTPVNYGALYQWGRKADGHESRISRTSAILSNTDNPGKPAFITTTVYVDNIYDWRSPQNDSLWNAGTELAPQKAANDPSPAGYRVPTYTEIQSLSDTTYVKNEWNTQNGVNGRKFTDKATGNFIFLPAADLRFYNGDVLKPDSYGHYWSSTANGTNTYSLNFSSSYVTQNPYWRIYGLAVRPVVDSKDTSAIAVISLGLNKTTLTLTVGDSATLTAIISPSNAKDRTVTWVTSDATKATINNGVVTAKALGTVTITALVGDKTATCTVTIAARAVSSISLNSNSLILTIGKDSTLTTTVLPSNATDKTVTWTTSDATKATVINGKITAIAAGTATITAKAGAITSTCFVTIFASSSTEDYVFINGVKWATHNVNTPGSFTTNPEDYGLFYQWNSKVGWPATGIVTGWNSAWNGGFTTPSASDTWATTNDPSPTGYHVPTYDQIRSLLNTTYVSSTWTTQNGVYGRKFTDKTSGNSIFLPASGYRYYNDGSLGNAGSSGHYWSSNAYSSNSADYLGLGSSTTLWDYYNRAVGQSVRPVAE